MSSVKVRVEASEIIVRDPATEWRCSYRLSPALNDWSRRKS
jgi:hypothetical protein